MPVQKHGEGQTYDELTLIFAQNRGILEPSDHHRALERGLKLFEYGSPEGLALRYTHFLLTGKWSEKIFNLQFTISKQVSIFKYQTFEKLKIDI